MEEIYYHVISMMADLKQYLIALGEIWKKNDDDRSFFAVFSDPILNILKQFSVVALSCQLFLAICQIYKCFDFEQNFVLPC